MGATERGACGSSSRGPTRKLKVSLTLSEDLLARVDREAAGTDGGRSGVVERWLRRAVAADVERAIDNATAAYYASLRGAPEDEAIARASSSAARRVHYGDAPRPRARTR